MQTFAIIPAAGKSTRMGRPKLSLPLGERTVLEWVVAALRQAGVADILVVVAPHVADLQRLAEHAGASSLLLPQETVEMRATVSHGLRWIQDHHRPQPDDCWLLVPADHPTLDAAVVRQLVAARQASGKDICVPVFQGKRGHPTLVAWKLAADVLQLPEGTGLNRFFRQHQDDTVEFPVSTPEVLRDLDTPTDYEQLRADWESRTP